MAKTTKSQNNNSENTAQPVYYDIIVWETRENSQKKHVPHKVGFASQMNNGNLACKLVDGIALTGKFTIAPQGNGN